MNKLQHAHGIEGHMGDALWNALKGEWNETHFEVTKNGVPSILIIYHNLPTTSGLSIDDAFTNWLVRTKEGTDASFVEYIMSKWHMHGNFAFTKEGWKELWDSVNS